MKALKIDTNYECIKRLNDEYRDNWLKIKDACEEIFINDVAYKNQTYTPHGAGHCNNIYKYISMIIENNDYSKISNSEYYILNTAVLIHDIIMVYNPGSARFNHSALVRKFLDDKIYGQDLNKLRLDLHEAGVSDEIINKVLNEGKLYWDKRRDVFEMNIDRRMKDYICDIVEAHSDIKNTDGSININTFEKLYNKYSKEVIYDDYNKKINIIQLAALLRIADELDITYSRAKGIKVGEYNINPESKKHWDMLELFLDIKLDKNFDIILVIDDKKLERSSDYINDINLIINTQEKIQNTINLVNKYAFSDRNSFSWSYTKVILETNNQILLKANRQNPLENQPDQRQVNQPDQRQVNKPDQKQENQPDQKQENQTDQKQENQPDQKQENQPDQKQENQTDKRQVNQSEATPCRVDQNHTNQADYSEADNIYDNLNFVDKRLSKTLEEFIAKNELLRSGHFYIADDRLARDWVEVKDIMDNPNIKQKIINAITNKINAPLYDNRILFIGINDIGVRLCSSLTVYNNFPDITYFIGNTDDIFDSYLPDSIISRFNSDYYKKIILFTDVIVTGKTIKRYIDLLVDTYKINISLIDVYTILYRKQISITNHNLDLYSNLKVFYVNDTISIQMCDKICEECIYRKYEKDLYSNKRR